MGPVKCCTDSMKQCEGDCRTSVVGWGGLTAICAACNRSTLSGVTALEEQHLVQLEAKCHTKKDRGMNHGAAVACLVQLEAKCHTKKDRGVNHGAAVACLLYDRISVSEFVLTAHQRLHRCLHRMQ